MLLILEAAGEPAVRGPGPWSRLSLPCLTPLTLSSMPALLTFGLATYRVIYRSHDSSEPQIPYL